MRRSRALGFSLIELMVTIAIVAILLALGLPSFEGSMRSNRVATTTNEMLASLALARSEAIRGSHKSVICASVDGSTCGAGLDWNDGWIVAADFDRDAAGDFEQIVRYVQAHPRVVFAGTAATKIEFDYRGRPNPVGSAGTITVQPDQCPTDQALRRELTLNGVGQVTTKRTACI
jgi:type IV fimbrial biogenesis protein FimT